MLLFFFKPSHSSDSVVPVTPERRRGGRERKEKPIEFSYALYQRYQRLLKEKYKKPPLTEKVKEGSHYGDTQKQPQSKVSLEQIQQAAQALSKESQPNSNELQERLLKLEGLADLAQLALDKAIQDDILYLTNLERLKRQTEEAHKKLLLILIQDE